MSTIKIDPQKRGKKEEPNSFTFALTFLATAGTIIYALYNYFQRSTLDDSLFRPVMAFTITLLVFSFFLIIYVLIIGISTVLKYDEKNKLTDKANNVYKISFLIGIFSLLNPISYFIYNILAPNNPAANYPSLVWITKIHFWIILIIIYYLFYLLYIIYFSIAKIKNILYGIIIEIVFVFWYIKASIFKLNPINLGLLLLFCGLVLSIILYKVLFKIIAKIKNILKEIIIIIEGVFFISISWYINASIFNLNPFNSGPLSWGLVLLLVIIICSVVIKKNYDVKGFEIIRLGIFITLFISLLSISTYVPDLFQSKAVINLDNNIYYNNSTPIPVSIEITGRRTNSSIYLNKSSGNKLIQIDEFALGPNYNDTHIFGKIKYYLAMFLVLEDIIFLLTLPTQI